MYQLFDITDKVIVITGASRGLGKNMALGLAEHGAKIVAVATNVLLLEMVKSEIEKNGGCCEIFPADISVEKNVEALAAFVEKNYGSADVLINNAGINRRGYLTEMSKDDWDATIAVNLTAGFLCLKHFAHLMKKQRQGKIINIASIMATAVAPMAGSYCASKGGIAQMTKVAAVELADYNIQVNAIAPGYFATEINDKYLKDPEKAKTIISKVPLARWGNGNELVGTAIYLASDASSFVTGHILTVDGGYLCL